LAAEFSARAGAPPLVSNVTAAQRPGTKLVDISYTISDPNFTFDNVFILVSKDSGATWTVPATTFIVGSAIGSYIPVTAAPTTNTITWEAGVDWDGNYTTNCRVRVLANNLGLVLIPAGTFRMGNVIGDSDLANDQAAGISDCYPVNVTISNPYYMDSTLVTGGKWNLVVQSYAANNGYTFENAGSYKASNHPVERINWLDAVKWCNARSEMEGITPVYYTDGTYTTVLRTGAASSTIPSWKPGANGYRLPTEAEWEKAARGGVAGHRFPWPGFDSITESWANYNSSATNSYDLGPAGFNTNYATGAFPFTSPVGSFAANGYGLFDMAGNVFEWCWDIYSSSAYGPPTDPQWTGPGSTRVLRGGSWDMDSNYARCANRFSESPNAAFIDNGFRCVRGVP